jgi:hypothetical protein
MKIKFLGNWLIGKYFVTEDTQEIDFILSTIPMMISLGADEKAVLILGEPTFFGAKPIPKTIITNKRIILRVKPFAFDQHIFKNIETIEAGNFKRAFAPSINLNSGKKVDLFTHMNPRAELSQKVTRVLQEHWANSN